MKNISSVIVPPTASGSLGDQAMLDSLVTEANALFGLPPSVLPNAYSVRAPAQMIDFGKGKTQQVIGIAKLLRARIILAMGADIMDGFYGTSQVKKRFNLLHVAHRIGAKTRIVGSSFSNAPRAEVIDRVRRMPWLEICARDPISKSRMEESLQRDVVLVSDVAFLLEPQITSRPAERAADWTERQRGLGRRIIGLNVSGMVLKNMGAKAFSEFSDQIARHVSGRDDIALLVMPHDWRQGSAGDLAACQTLHAKLKHQVGERCEILEEQVSAWETKALAGMLDCALVSRMHLAVACLGQGKPPYCLVYAGKFEGLMEHFGLIGNLFDPTEMKTAEQMLRPFEYMLDAWKKDAKIVTAALPKVLDLSRRNLDGL